jgi:hypothetical protein
MFLDCVIYLPLAKNMPEKKNLFELLQETSTERKRHLLVFIPSERIGYKHVVKIENLLRGKKDLELDILIHSSGGSAHSAYQIASLLHSKTKSLNVVIPLYAKSAATLLCLGAKEIILGEIAQLGPLDTQIEERQKGETTPTSALNPFKALEQLTEFSSSAMDIMTKLLLTRAPLEVGEAVRHGIDFSTKISSSLFQQLNAEKLGQYSRALSIGYEYGLRLLTRSKSFPPAEAKKVLDKLIYGYPSHDYIIDASELKELGLPAKVCGDGCFGNMHTIADSIMEYNRQTDTPVIELIEPQVQPEII